MSGHVTPSSSTSQKHAHIRCKVLLANHVRQFLINRPRSMTQIPNRRIWRNQLSLISPAFPAIFQAVTLSFVCSGVNPPLSSEGPRGMESLHSILCEFNWHLDDEICCSEFHLFERLHNKIFNTWEISFYAKVAVCEIRSRRKWRKDKFYLKGKFSLIGLYDLCLFVEKQWHLNYTTIVIRVPALSGCISYVEYRYR